MHVEWRTPEGVPAEVRGQSRSSSGVFLMGRYEVQVLDLYTDDNYQSNQTYAHGAGPISIQDHSNPMRFRNIWIREWPEGRI